MNALDEVTESFSRLPGIGKKSAGRIANFLLRADESFVQRFATQVSTLKERIKPCSVCGAWTENDPCPICSDDSRDRKTLCVVEQPQDVATIEIVRYTAHLISESKLEEYHLSEPIVFQISDMDIVE